MKVKTLVCLAALAGLLAGCKASQEAKPAEPRQPAAPAAPPAPAPAPAPVDSKPITVDLSKFEAAGEFRNLDHHGYDDGQERMFYYSNGLAETKLKVPADGEYEITVKAACDEAQNEFARFRVRVDEQAISGEVVLTGVDPKDYKIVAKIAAGERKLGIEFTNDLWKEGEYDRNLFIHGVALKRVK